jgi:Protein of unknown function (DUF3102)
MTLQTIEVEAVQTLPALIDQINEAHEQCRQAYQSSLAHARRCGELLIEAKRQVDFGDWLTWLQANCTVAVRTAQAYMQVARDWNKLEENATVAHLSLKDALTLLNTSEEADSEIEPPKSDTPDAFEQPIAANLNVGDRAIVSKVDHLHHGTTVIVVERRSGLYFADLPNGTSYLFMPTELRKVEALPTEEPPSNQPEPPKPKPFKTEVLRSLLDRVYKEVGHHLTGDLLAEVEAELGYR